MFGTQVAQVARAACSQVEHANPKSLPMRLAEDPSSAVQQLDISKLSSDASDAASNGDSQHNGVNGHHKHRVNGAPGEDRMVKHNLAVLAEGSFTFLLQDTNDTSSWYIDKLKFNKFVWDKEMYRLIGETLTEPTLRIVRMLADKGKLDEKAMQEIGLLNPKELRKCLAALQRVGFLELQEVPKDPHRLPKNTFFLYFYDPERVRKVFVEKLYKAMARMYQQLHLERIKIASTLGKLDRLDIGSEVEILSAAELQVFYNWQRKECWFTTEIHRMDDSISILRDV
jgi:DNA-directed RNA polymerase III subunit RPC3